MRTIVVILIVSLLAVLGWAQSNADNYNFTEAVFVGNQAVITIDVGKLLLERFPEKIHSSVRDNFYKPDLIEKIYLVGSNADYSPSTWLPYFDAQSLRNTFAFKNIGNGIYQLKLFVPPEAKGKRFWVSLRFTRGELNGWTWLPGWPYEGSDDQRHSALDVPK